MAVWINTDVGSSRCAGTCDRGLLVLGALQVLLHQFGRHTDDVLTFPVFHHVERLQRADDVTLRDAGHLAESRRALNAFITTAERLTSHVICQVFRSTFSSHSN